VRIVYSWLREFVDVAALPEELGQTLSMRGFELGSVERVGGDEAVLDFEITANRPDALSVIGLAREAATAYSQPLRHPPRKRLQTSATSGDVGVTLEAPDLCPRYAAAVVDVTVAPSPAWLATRLQAAGVRPISNVVDVTNYVLLELGQPMHAFDLEKLTARELRIRRAKKGERITTLDGIDRTLDPEMLVIADGERPQAVAGVMGGGLSEIGPTTRTIVLESACFNPKSVRLTSKRFALKTEASSRFERGADIGAPVAGIERAVELLETIGAGQMRGDVIDRYPSPLAPRTLGLRYARIQRVLGHDVPEADVERILRGLGFGVGPAETDSISADAAPHRTGVGWNVTVPTFRVDVAREVDLIEEVGRHHGYDRLPTTFPPLLSPPPPPDRRIETDRLVRRVLLAAGCSEALTFSFIEAAQAAPFDAGDAIVPISNPLSAQFSVLRPSLLPGLLSAVAHNRNRERADVSLFELGATVTRSGESRRVAIARIGDGNGTHWSSARRSADFFDVKGIVEQLSEALLVDLVFDADAIPSFLVRGRAAAVVSDRRPVGAVGMLVPAIAARAGLSANEDVYVAELDLNALAAIRTAAPLTAKPLPRFPSIARDISIVVNDILPAATVRGTIRSIAPETLVSVREFDRYQGKGVPEGRVSLSLRLTFRSPERTLTDAEVQRAMDAIIAALIKEHQAVQR
jgi:phenylalanyl-tRNA synthetase beta chain